MAEILSLIILLVGVLGMVVIILRKIPALIVLPPQEPGSGFFQSIAKKIKNHERIKDFSFEDFLHKILSKIRIVVLKTENKMSFWLSHLRKKSIEKKNNLYNLTEFESLYDIFEGKIEPFIINPSIERIKEYLKKLDN